MEQIVLIVLGVVVIVLFGILGLANKTRRGQAYIRLLGETGARIMYFILGTILIILSLFL